MQDIDTSATEMMRDFSLTNQEIIGLVKFSDKDVIPGTESFISRLIGSISNIFQRFSNALHEQIYSWEAILTQNWKQYAERWIDRLNNNLPDTEQFTGTISLRGTKQMMEKNKAAMTAVVNLASHLDRVILSPEKDILPRELRQVISYLEMNHCTIDPARPSQCSAGTRFTYGELGRLGTSGYGSEPSIYVSSMRHGIDDWYRIYTAMTNSQFVDTAVKKMEAEINRLSAAMEKATDAKKLDMAQQINNVRARMVAYRAILRATIDMWNTTLITHFIIPLQNLGRKAGLKDDFISWILATKED